MGCFQSCGGVFGGGERSKGRATLISSLLPSLHIPTLRLANQIAVIIPGGCLSGSHASSFLPPSSSTLPLHPPLYCPPLRHIMILRHVTSMNALGRCSSLVRRRLLHLQSHDAIAFLSNRIHDASITASSTTTSKKVLSFLLHADRRPRSLPPSRSTDSIKTHFGPSLIGCHKAILDANNTSSTDDDRLSLGLGDLGILKAQRDTPSKVVQVPISLEKGLSLDYAFGFLIRMAPIAGFSLPEPLTWKAAEVLQTLWTTFKECEGIWFTGELVFDDGNVTV